MKNKIISYFLHKPGLVILALLCLLIAGLYEFKTMPVEAFPDISPVMVPIFSESHGLAPEEIERLITWPIESAMNGLPGVIETRSTSAFGLSVVYVYFEDSIDIYFARQVVAERLISVTGDLPKLDGPPSLGPISTGLGQIFIYYLKADPEKVNTEGKELNTWLREINDWLVKYQLQTVKGVTAVLSMGGHVLQYQIRINPDLLAKYQVSLDEVVEAVKNNNRNAGGQFLLLGSEEHLVRGIGLIQSLDDLKKIQVKATRANPILLSDIAEISFGNEIRRGVVTRNGTEEIVSGIVMKLYGANTSQVIERLHNKLDQLQKALPAGVTIHAGYDQAELVKNATDTVIFALLQGAVLVFLVLIFFLGNWRSAALVIISLPLCTFTALILMGWHGVSANLMSLGGIAIAIGMLCDGSIVVIESILAHLKTARKTGKPVIEAILSAVSEVANPVIFSGIIVIIVFLPLMTLQGIEGKMFTPMAFSISAAMLGSVIAALFFMPGLAALFMKNESGEETVVVKHLQNRYRRLLTAAVQKSRSIVAAAGILFLIAVFMLFSAGTEFIPALEEGSIFISVVMAPSIALEKATELILNLEKQIVKFAEVEEVISRIGRPEAGSHPHPVNYGEVQIKLKPLRDWKNHRTKNDLIEALNKNLSETPGIHLNFTQPIQNAFDELISGVKSQLAIKIYGEDLKILQQTAEDVHNKIHDIPGLVDTSVEQSFGQPQVQVTADREKCARYGIDLNHVLEMVEMAVGGENIGTVFFNNRRFAINLRYQENHRNDPQILENLLIPRGDGSLVPVHQVASIQKVTGPMQINRENNHRRWIVQGNIRGRDMGNVVKDIKERVSEQVKLATGYTIEYGGQFANQQRAMLRLSLIVPAAISGVLIMLWLSFSSLRHALIIFTMVPFSIIGGVFGLYLTGQYLSVPASIGFIALFGMAMLDGMVMVTRFNELRRQGKTISESITEGSESRLGPVLVTTLTTLLGLLPLLMATGAGSEVQRPLAGVVVFGLFSSTILTLFLIPAVYSMVENHSECSTQEQKAVE